MIRALGWTAVLLWAVLSLSTAFWATGPTRGPSWASALATAAISLGFGGLILGAYHRGRAQAFAEMAALARAAQLAGGNGGP